MVLETRDKSPLEELFQNYMHFFYILTESAVEVNDVHIGSNDINCKYQYYNGFQLQT